MTGDLPPPPSEGTTPRRWLAASIFGLSGLAIAAPAFLALGSAATLFTAHAAGRAEVLAITAAFLLLPALVAVLLLELARIVAPRVRAHLVHLVIGGLAAMVIVPSIDRASGLRSIWFAALVVAITLGTAAVHRRKREVRTFVRVTVVAPLPFVVWFLFFSSVSGIVLPQRAIGEARAARDTNVLYLILDELPLSALLAGDGTIDERRYPNFGRLASASTWYRHATTVAPWTHLAIPAMVSGKVPAPDDAPTPRSFPRNIFTMLSPTHSVEAVEMVTNLCPPDVCAGSPAARSSLYRDAAIVYLHSQLPDGAAARLLPPLGDRWGGFRSPDDDWLELFKEGSRDDPAAAFEAFHERVADTRSSGPTVWFGHVLLPHLPIRYLPDGKVYEGMVRPDGLGDDWITWTDDPSLMDAARQRFLLQLKYTDHLVGRLLDTLGERGVFEDTMIIIAADHGLSFEPGEKRRASPLTSGNAADIMAVPLFVKYPGQTDAEVDERRAQVTDVMPTIAEVLEVHLPDDWSFDGVSLKDRRARTDGISYVDPGGGIEPPARLDLSGSIERYRQLFGDRREADDIYAWGPHRELVGAPAPASPETRGTTVKLDDHAAFGSVDTRSPAIPALVKASIEGAVGPGETIAVSLNGTIAGLGTTFEQGERLRVAVMVSPAYLIDGANELGFYRVIDPSSLRALPLVAEQPR